MNSQWELINMHEWQYIACALALGAAAGAARQRERCLLPGKEGATEGRSPVPPQHPAPEPPPSAGPAFRGYRHARSLAEAAAAARVSEDGYCCRFFNHGMQFVRAAEARRAVQVTVWSLSGKESDFISKSESSLSGLWPTVNDRENRAPKTAYTRGNERGVGCLTWRVCDNKYVVSHLWNIKYLSLCYYTSHFYKMLHHKIGLRLIPPVGIR